MKVTFEINGHPLVLDAERDTIAQALDKAIREDEDLYRICVEVVGKYLSERVHAEGKKQGLFEPAKGKTRKYSTKNYNIKKRAQNEKGIDN